MTGFEWAVPGARVVCIGWRMPPVPNCVTRPKKGEIVTIREVGLHPISLDVCLRFVEHANPVVYTTYGPYETQFCITRVRPLVTRTAEQDMAIFAPLLTPDPQLLTIERNLSARAWSADWERRLNALCASLL